MALQGHLTSRGPLYLLLGQLSDRVMSQGDRDAGPWGGGVGCASMAPVPGPRAAPPRPPALQRPRQAAPRCGAAPTFLGENTPRVPPSSRMATPISASSASLGGQSRGPLEPTRLREPPRRQLTGRLTGTQWGSGHVARGQWPCSDPSGQGVEVST